MIEEEIEQIDPKIEEKIDPENTNGETMGYDGVKTNIALGVTAAVAVGVAAALQYAINNGKFMTVIREDVPKTIIKEDTLKTIIIDTPKTIINENNNFVQGISLLILAGFLLYISK